MILLRHAALGAASMTLWLRVREGDGTANWGHPIIEAMIRNVGVGKPIPWCACALQTWTDAGALALGVKNPLDGVKYEDTVQSYADWADAQGGLRPLPPDAGDAVLYRFGAGARFNHCGILVSPPSGLTPGAPFIAIEGNTDAHGGREGREVALKGRAYDPGIMRFVRWDEVKVA